MATRADGERHQAAVAGDLGGVLVGPALHGVVHRAGERHKDRVGRGGQVRHRGEQVVPAREVGALVREQRRAARLVQCLEQAAGDHDPARPAGQGVRLDGGAANDHDGAVLVQAGGAPVGLGQGAGPVPERDRDGHRGHGQHHGGHRAGDGGGGIGAVHDALGVVPQRGHGRYAGDGGGREQRQRHRAAPGQDHRGPGEQPGGLPRFQPGGERPGRDRREHGDQQRQVHQQPHLATPGPGRLAAGQQPAQQARVPAGQAGHEPGQHGAVVHAGVQCAAHLAGR